MTFVDTLMSWLSRAFGWLGDIFSKLFDFLAVPFGWLISILEGIWYFLTVLFSIVVAVIKIFVALFQFLGSLILGFMRTIKQLLVIDFSQTPVNYVSETGTGIKVIVDLLEPVGFLTVVPMVLLAIVWIYFIIRVFALLGGEANIDA